MARIAAERARADLASFLEELDAAALRLEERRLRSQARAEARAT